MEPEDALGPDYPPGEEPIERADRALDIMSLSPDQFDIFMAGYEAGRAGGLEDGYQQCEEAYASRHRYALQVMRRSGRLDLSPDEILDC